MELNYESIVKDVSVFVKERVDTYVKKNVNKYDIMKENLEYLYGLPLLKKFREENERLERENSRLRSELFEVRIELNQIKSQFGLDEAPSYDESNLMESEFLKFVNFGNSEQDELDILTQLYNEEPVTPGIVLNITEKGDVSGNVESATKEYSGDVKLVSIDIPSHNVEEEVEVEVESIEEASVEEASDEEEQDVSGQVEDEDASEEEVDDEESEEEVEEASEEEVEDASDEDEEEVEEEVSEEEVEDESEEVEDESEEEEVSEEEVEDASDEEEVEDESEEEEVSEEEVEDASDEEEVEDASDEEEEASEDEEDLEVMEFKYKNQLYFVTDDINGDVYEYLEDEEVGDQIGELRKGKLFLY